MIRNLHCSIWNYYSCVSHYMYCIGWSRDDVV